MSIFILLTLLRIPNVEYFFTFLSQCLSLSFTHCKRFTTDKAYFNYLIENLRSIFLIKQSHFILITRLKKLFLACAFKINLRCKKCLTYEDVFKLP